MESTVVFFRLQTRGCATGGCWPVVSSFSVYKRTIKPGFVAGSDSEPIGNYVVISRMSAKRTLRHHALEAKKYASHTSQKRTV
jgi:hypothetical protein